MSRQLGRRDHEVVTLSALRQACVTFYKGIVGVQLGSKPVEVEDSELERVMEGAIEWFGALADAFGPEIEDRENTIDSRLAGCAGRPGRYGA